MRGVMAQLTFYNLKKKHKDSEHMVLSYVNSYETYTVLGPYRFPC